MEAHSEERFWSYRTGCATFFAKISASSFPLMPIFPGIHASMMLFSVATLLRFLCTPVPLLIWVQRARLPEVPHDYLYTYYTYYNKKIILLQNLMFFNNRWLVLKKFWIPLFPKMVSWRTFFCIKMIWNPQT